MQGLDTNVLVCLVTRDDPEQAERVPAFVEDAERRGEPLRVAVPVLCELAWVLQGRLYRYDRPSIAAVLERLLETRVLVIEARDVVRQALDDFRHGRADFPDYLVGRQNRDAGCDATVTLDGRLADEPGFAALG
jgi:predicted nucleic-acid-binding protein